MLNQCTFIGRLGADPSIKRTQDGKSVVNLNLAVSKKWKSKDGERKERTTWVPIVIFNDGLCKVAEAYLKKGSLIYVSGEFTVRKWQDQQGNDRYSTEVVLQGFGSTLTMLDSKGEGQQTTHERHLEKLNNTGPAQAGGGEIEDEIPFAPDK